MLHIRKKISLSAFLSGSQRGPKRPINRAVVPANPEARKSDWPVGPKILSLYMKRSAHYVQK